MPYRKKEDRVSAMMDMGVMTGEQAENAAADLIGVKQEEIRSFIAWFLKYAPYARVNYPDCEDWYYIEWLVVEHVCASDLPFLEKFRFWLDGLPKGRPTRENMDDYSSWNDCFFERDEDGLFALEPSFRGEIINVQFFTLWAMTLGGSRHAFELATMASAVDWGEYQELVSSVAPHIAERCEQAAELDFWIPLLRLVDQTHVALEVPMIFRDILAREAA